MDFFLTYHENRGDLSLTNRMLLVLDGHKSHVTFEVLLKAKSHGLDMISLPSHTSHCLQPLDISCFRPFKESFRAHRDAWAKKNIGKRVGKKILAQWVSLALHRALTMSNIQARFRVARIQPLNKNAMVGKMGPSELFQPLQEPMETSDEEDVGNQSSQECNIEVEEILEEGIPTSLRYYTQYYINIEEEPSTFSHQFSMGEPSTSVGISHFLRVPHIEVPMGHRVRSEPFINYSQSQILTSANHVEKLEQIVEKKACIEKERAAKVKERELTKARRVEERIIAAAAKERRVVEKEARKINKQNWTTTAVRAAGERMQ